MGFIDYERFQDLVMDGVRSSFANASAIATTATNGNSVSMSDAALRTTSDANCNSEQFLRRKVKEHWKYLAIDFKHMAEKDGNMAPAVLRKVLYKFDILPSEDMWADVCARMDEDGDGFISFQEFMNFFGKEQGDREAYFIGKLKNIQLKVAKQMIQDKVRGKIEGGPGAQRRAFQFFDRDRSGRISHAEFCAALKE